MILNPDLLMCQRMMLDELIAQQENENKNNNNNIYRESPTRQGGFQWGPHALI